MVLSVAIQWPTVPCRPATRDIIKCIADVCLIPGGLRKSRALVQAIVRTVDIAFARVIEIYALFHWQDFGPSTIFVLLGED